MDGALDGLAERLKKALKDADMTQGNIASLIGTSQPAVSQWLTGKKEPTPENLADIARHLRVRTEWLTSGIPPMKVTDPESDRAEYFSDAGWGFRRAPDDGGRDYGNSNVWSFDPGLDVLVREVLQNTKDAALSADKKVEVTFRIITLTGMDLNEFREAMKWDDLRPHLDDSKDGKQKFNTLLRDGLDQLDKRDELLLLTIEDTGTTGLTGPERGDGHFTALCRNNLDSNKEGAGGAGGAFGLGKAVLWRASRLSTVLFCSHLSKPEVGKTAYRVFGRCELAWHKTEDTPYAGPGWFGRTDSQGNADSYWENKTLAEALYLDREGVGTTTCVIGFHDASADTDRKPVELAQELARAAAENFFPALVANKLGVRVEVYDSGQQYKDRKPAFSQAVNPEAYVPASVRMLRAYWEDTAVEQFGETKDEVATREVTLTVPKRIEDPKHPEQEHKAVLLVTAADEEVPSTGFERPNQLAMFRGPGMVVQVKSLAGLCLGARPFHALLLCGRAPEFVAPGISRATPQSDLAAETFLRTAEPPSHNQWTATPDLKSVYARGCKTRLEAFLKAAADGVRELVKPAPKETGDGPNSLKELFRIGSEPAARPERSRVIEQRGDVDGEGRWRVSARVRLKARKTWQRLTPAVYFLAETGSGTPVSWESLRAEKGCDVSGLTLLVPPDTREIRFAGLTDPKSHPIPAGNSCAVVDIRKLTEVKESAP
jgi:transcriptional regulator with XRE-family HTH domain